MTEWQPLDTLPMHKEVLLAVHLQSGIPGDQCVVVGEWTTAKIREQTELEGERHYEQDGRCYVIADDSHYFDSPIVFTHWMPLPKPPQLDGGAKE